MSSKTGLRYLGEGTYAFKRNLSYGAFVPITELFKLYGTKSGFNQPSYQFVQWLFNSGKIPASNFEFEIDKSDFDTEGNYLKSFSSKASSKNRRMTETRDPKSSQVVNRPTEQVEQVEQVEDVQEDQFDLEDHEEAQFEQEVPQPPTIEEANTSSEDHSGTVKEESTEVHVSNNLEDAQQDLVEQARELHRNNTQRPVQSRGMQANIVENKVEKPSKIERSDVVRGGTNKGSRNQRSRAVVLGENQGPVTTSPVNTKELHNKNSERAFTHNPAPSQLDVNANPPVNYGGRSSTPNPAAKAPTPQAPAEVVGAEKKNVMSSPSVANVSDLRSPVTIDTIVRNPSESSALEAINTCKNSKILKLAAKQLRNMGTKQSLEKAIARRLNTLPPGSVG